MKNSEIEGNSNLTMDLSHDVSSNEIKIFLSNGLMVIHEYLECKSVDPRLPVYAEKQTTN